MDYKMKPLIEIGRHEWDNFCNGSRSAWFRHTTCFLDCILNCRFDMKSKNLSFGAYQNNKLTAVIPLIMQTVYDEPEIFEFGFADTNTPFPAFKNDLSRDDKNRLLKIIFVEVNRIAVENNVSYSRFFVDPLSEDVLRGGQRINPITKFGYHETSLSTNIIELSGSEEEIFANIRKGHKADIKAAKKKYFRVDIFDKRNISREIFEIYRNLHFIDAGRKTRPDESWDNMHDFIKDGKSALALVKSEKEYIAGALVIIYKDKAYYGSGATHPGFSKERGVGHLLQWEVVKHLKAVGVKYYEIGWNFYSVISQNVISDKEVNISKFKAGFGGDSYPIFRGEKFYSKEYFLKAYSDRMNQYADKNWQ